jgi:hypothetical protein
VARLAKVDGAVLMQPDLGVLGFGATIGERADLQMRLVDGRAGSAAPPARGHRHKSTARDAG